MNAKRTLAIITMILVSFAGMASAEEATRWINVNVEEHSDGTKVQVHLPLNLVLAVIDGINIENFDHGKVDLELDDMDVNWPEVFAAIQDAPDGDFVTVSSPDADVRVSKSGGMMLIDVNEKEHDNANVKVRVPMSMINSLHIDDENRVDVKAFLQSLNELPDGELVRVESDDANVRVWVE
ncbi:MAG: hypothetical protein GY906_01210 [bacterium]|nr:hypothetical protein [bacterium]